MTAYLALNAALWGCATVAFCVFNFTEPTNERNAPPMQRLGPTTQPIEWGRTLAWLALLAGMTAWPLWLIYGR